MPTSSDELRNWARTKFGDISEYGPEEFLKSKGFKLGNKWGWISPYKKDTQLETDVVNAITFLIEEWDYDGILSYEGADPDPSAALNQGATYSS